MAEQIGMVHKMPRPIGRPLRFKNAEEIWDKFVEYCDYIDNNPWQLKSASNSIDSTSSDKDKVKVNDVKRNGMRQDVRVFKRAYTLYGFCAFAGICYKWAVFKANYSRKGENFKNVIEQIENVVCAQQVDGAMINQFNGSLVARLNGIADTTIQEIVGKDGEEFKWPKLTLEDIETLKKANGL